ncbi:MAG: NADH-quinone oxidoreductase subunit NuoG [Pseudomonadales bacterium]
MPRITVDGQDYDVQDGQNLLHACLSHGLDLPYFCWHPAMGSVGACRQCAVTQYQDADDTQGRLTMACMTPAADSARISIKAPNAEAFRASVIEWLMENHPHDCPVCEEGGECHLQDMTVMTGHTKRRYTGSKRTFNNQYLGPLINHEMNRCITCYRCVRFYRDYAGGTDLAAFGSRDRMYFGRAEPGVLESEFSGNLVEVCPTGVFTDRPFSKAYSRKWDLQSAPSICSGCSLGCNLLTSERYGALKRVHNRYHADLNQYFICDRGRFGMTYTNSESRIRLTGERIEPGVFRQILPADAVAKFASVLASGSAVAIGSPRASMEDNFALRQLVGENNYCSGLSSNEGAAMALVGELSDLPAPSLRAVEDADAILILGEDVLNTAPRLALAIRQATRNLADTMAAEAGIPLWQDAGVRGHAQHNANPVLVGTVLPTGLDDIATFSLNASPAALARCGFAIAHRLDNDYVGAADLSAAQAQFVEAAARALGEARRPLIVTGVSSGEHGLLKAAGNIAQALNSAQHSAHLLVCGAETNSFGVNRLNAGLDMDSALNAVIEGKAETLIVMQNDLYRRADPALVGAAVAAAKNVVVLDSLDNATGNHANLVFPAATFTEATGTVVNYEGRAQRFYQVFVPKDNILPAWRWFSAVNQRLGRNDTNWRQVDDVLHALSALAEFSGVAGVAPSALQRSAAGQKVPRAPHRYSGRTAMHADQTLHEPKTLVDEETPFAYSMEGENRNQAGSLIPYFWSPGWNSNQSVFKFQNEVGGSMRGGDPGIMLPAIPRGKGARFDAPPALGQPRNAEFALIRLPVLFGSDELTAYAQAIEELTPDPFVVLHPEDARALQVADGDGVLCGEDQLEVRTHAAMTPGYAGVSAGLPNAPAWLPDTPVALRRDPDFVKRPTIIARG